MRPDTVHAVAQFIRHTRGYLNAIEKWIAHTPPERVAEESAQVLQLARLHLTELETRLGHLPVNNRTGASLRSQTDRPDSLARSPRT
jgi:hypothetical protein